jgi:hypothetical protein
MDTIREGRRTMRYVVIENTLGYLDDEPFETDDYAEAVEYLNERAAAYEDDPDERYYVERGIASGDNLAAVKVYAAGRINDLGRYIGIERADLDETKEDE